MFLVPPAITLKQAVIQANEEEDIELSCQAIGVPNPTIKWYKASGGLPLSNRLQYITPNRIKIESVQLSDAGEYTCRADNSQGFAEEKITVIVKSTYPTIYCNRQISICKACFMFVYLLWFHITEPNI